MALVLWLWLDSVTNAIVLITVAILINNFKTSWNVAFTVQCIDCWVEKTRVKLECDLIQCSSFLELGVEFLSYISIPYFASHMEAHSFYVPVSRMSGICILLVITLSTVAQEKLRSVYISEKMACLSGNKIHSCNLILLNSDYVLWLPHLHYLFTYYILNMLSSVLLALQFSSLANLHENTK